MKKYQKQSGMTVDAEYGEEQGNPFFEALPEILGKEEVMKRLRSQIPYPKDIQKMSPEERRKEVMEISKWFYPMDYMYTIYDMLYRAMSATYQTKNIVDHIRQMNDLYMDFRTGREREFQYATQAYTGAVLGVPGIGKTSTVQRCLSLMPKVIVHTNYGGKPMYTKQINYLFVECPSDCSVRTLAFNIFSAIDRAIGSDYLKQATYQRAVAASATTTKLKIICMNHHIGLIVIDEIQNAIQTAVKNRQLKPLVKFLVELTNETSTGICFCGTMEAEDLFMSQEHLKRRTRGFRLLPLKYDVTYRKFITELWDSQVVLQKTELSEKLMKQIYDLSAGIPSYIVKIFQEAQVQAILTGKEKLSYEVLKQAIMCLGIEVPKTYGWSGTSISDFTVQEVTVNEEAVESVEIEVETTEETSLEGDCQEEISLDPVDGRRDKLDAENIMDEELPGSAEKTSSKRFYAVKRGRKKSERDDSDLLELWTENPSADALLLNLEQFHMLERRCF